MSKKSGKKYYEAEFRVWVEEPDPEEKPPCGALWTGDWDHAHGTRPQCFRPEDHAGEHHDTRKGAVEDTWVDYYWGEDATSARKELRRSGAVEE